MFPTNGHFVGLYVVAQWYWGGSPVGVSEWSLHVPVPVWVLSGLPSFSLKTHTLVLIGVCMSLCWSFDRLANCPQCVDCFCWVGCSPKPQCVYLSPETNAAFRLSLTSGGVAPLLDAAQERVSVFLEVTSLFGYTTKNILFMHFWQRSSSKESLLPLIVDYESCILITYTLLQL